MKVAEVDGGVRRRQKAEGGIGQQMTAQGNRRRWKAMAAVVAVLLYQSNKNNTIYYKKMENERVELEERIQSLEMSIPPKTVDVIIGLSLKHQARDIDALREKARLLSLYLSVKKTAKSIINCEQKLLNSNGAGWMCKLKIIRCNVV